MRASSKFLLIIALLSKIASCVLAITLDYPRADETWITKVEGSNVVGTYQISGIFHGFHYDGTGWTSLDYPGAITSIWGIEENNLVGYYRIAPSEDYHGFLYDGATWTTVDKPGASSTLITGLYSGNLAGYYIDAFGNHGFMYDGITWMTFDKPGAVDTYVNDISSNDLVGNYFETNGISHGFLYDGASWITLDKPGGTNTVIRGVDSGNTVGSYSDAHGDHGFIYDGTKWTTFDYPGATATYIYGIDGDTIVGTYHDASDFAHGFSHTIPEPMTILLFGLGVFGLRKSFWKSVCHRGQVCTI